MNHDHDEHFGKQLNVYPDKPPTSNWPPVVEQASRKICEIIGQEPDLEVGKTRDGGKLKRWEMHALEVSAKLREAATRKVIGEQLKSPNAPTHQGFTSPPEPDKADTDQDGSIDLIGISIELSQAVTAMRAFIMRQNSEKWNKLSPRTMLAILYRIGLEVKH